MISIKFKNRNFW